MIFLQLLQILCQLVPGPGPSKDTKLWGWEWYQYHHTPTKTRSLYRIIGFVSYHISSLFYQSCITTVVFIVGFTLPTGVTQLHPIPSPNIDPENLPYCRVELCGHHSSHWAAPTPSRGNASPLGTAAVPLRSASSARAGPVHRAPRRPRRHAFERENLQETTAFPS